MATVARGSIEVRRSRNSSRSRVLPTPAGAITLTMKGRSSWNARPATNSSCCRSGPRPIKGVRAATGRRAARPSNARARIGWVLPRASMAMVGPKEKPALMLATVRSPQRMPQDSAACCSRAATLTASPLSGKSPVALSRAATTSPVLMPKRMGSRSPRPGSARTRSRSVSAAASARWGSSSCVCGKPKTATTASPMNFSRMPPCSLTISRATS